MHNELLGPFLATEGVVLVSEAFLLIGVLVVLVVPLAVLVAVGGLILVQKAHGEAGGDRSSDDIPHWMQDMRGAISLNFLSCHLES